MIQSLKAEHTAKYRTIREAIASDIRATQSARARLKDLQKSVNSENILISTTETIIAESVTPDLAIYEKNTQEAYTRMTQEDISESEVFKAGEALRAKALTYSARADENTVQYAAEESTSQSQGAGVAEFTYRGIYTVDNGQRTRFFDYTNELDGSERAIRINRIK